MPDVKVLRLRRDDVCVGCQATLPAGSRAGWHRAERVVRCLDCLGAGTVPPEQPPTAGVAGGSLQREYERRRGLREAHVRQRFPRLGGLLLALFGEPETTKAFARGADGERRLAQRLERECGDSVLFLHNRRLGTTSRAGDLDHIAVAPSGVFVIDAKHYPGAKVTVRRTGGLIRPVREELIVRGRNRSSFVDSMKRQHSAVVQAISDPAVPVRGVFCFIASELPLLGRLSVGGFLILTPRRTSKLVQGAGRFGADRRRELHERLARALPPA